MTCGRCGDTQWIGSDECMWCSDPAPQTGAPREEIVPLQRMARPRRAAERVLRRAAGGGEKARGTKKGKAPNERVEQRRTGP